MFFLTCSLLIMWPPCQEEWQHQVPRASERRMLQHPISGKVRVNLTFRHFCHDFASWTPVCWCKPPQLCRLRTVRKAGPHLGRYFYMCSAAPDRVTRMLASSSASGVTGPPEKPKRCQFFQWLTAEKLALTPLSGVTVLPEAKVLAVRGKDEQKAIEAPG